MAVRSGLAAGLIAAITMGLAACQGGSPEARGSEAPAGLPIAAADSALDAESADTARADMPANGEAGADANGIVATERIVRNAYVATNGPRARAPSVVRGIYLNAYAAGSRARLAALLALAERTEINAFVVDVKDERGVHYPTSVPLARELTQPGEVTIRNLAAFVDTLHARGIYAMARIVVFKDPILAKARPAWSVQTPDGEPWADRAGNTWVSPWDPNVWEYNLAIAEEVARAGFDEIQFDYIRFPEPYASLPTQVHPHANGDRVDAIVGFLDEARRRLHPLGAIVGADVFGLSPNDPRDINIGQQWEAVLAAADHVLPMVYPSHYFPTHLQGVPRPNRMPYETVFTSVGMGLVRAQRLRAEGVTTARVIPWLQAFSAPWVDRDFGYGPEQAAAQIRAVYDVGLEDWIFWHPGSRYEPIADAFERELAPRAVAYEPLPAVLRHVDLLDRQGARAARERMAERAKAAGGTN
jgi:hypothetical protein